MNVGYRTTPSFMIPAAVSSFRSRHTTRTTATTALQLTPRHPRLLPGPTYGALLFSLATRATAYFALPADLKLNSPSTTRLFLGVLLLGVSSPSLTPCFTRLRACVLTHDYESAV